MDVGNLCALDPTTDWPEIGEPTREYVREQAQNAVQQLLTALVALPPADAFAAEGESFRGPRNCTILISS